MLLSMAETVSPKIWMSVTPILPLSLLARHSVTGASDEAEERNLLPHFIISKKKERNLHPLQGTSPPNNLETCPSFTFNGKSIFLSLRFLFPFSPFSVDSAAYAFSLLKQYATRENLNKEKFEFPFSPSSSSVKCT
jgi:hypothetical protein